MTTDNEIDRAIRSLKSAPRELGDSFNTLGKKIINKQGQLDKLASEIADLRTEFVDLRTGFVNLATKVGGSVTK
jgi:uncharacterized protein YoxC